MKQKRVIWGVLFVSVLGVLGHFAYEFFGEPAIFGLFVPINESIWEHLKLLFYPVLLWWAVEWFFFPRSEPFLAPRTWALSLSLAAIPVVYYTYSGIVGRRFAAVDIGIFFAATGLYFWLTRRFSRSRESEEGALLLSLTALFSLLFAFWVFTFFPPDLGIFREP